MDKAKGKLEGGSQNGTPSINMWISTQARKLRKWWQRKNTVSLDELSMLSTATTEGEPTECTQMNADAKQSKGNYLIKRENSDIFDIVTTEEGSFITLGMYRLTDAMTLERARYLVAKRDWDLILRLVSIAIEMNEKNKSN